MFEVSFSYVSISQLIVFFPSYDYFYYLENDLRGYVLETYRNDSNYFQETVLSYKSGSYGEINYGVSFMNNKEEYFNHENSFEIINSISR